MAANSPITSTEPSDTIAAALRTIVQGTASETGEAFFPALVENLAKALGTHGAWVTEYLPEGQRLRALAFWLGGAFVPHFEHHIRGTPCEAVLEGRSVVHYPDRVLELYPEETDLRAAGAVSYMGVPLRDVDGAVMGHLAVLDRKPMPAEPRMLALFQIFAARASAELRRLRAAERLREREEKLSRLVACAMDAILELDASLHVTQANPAAETVFRSPSGGLVGRDFRPLLCDASRDELERRVAELARRDGGSRSTWIPSGLSLRRADGEVFVAEATVACSEQRGALFFTLILRDVNDRLEAERQLQSLASQAEYLRDEVGAGVRSDKILGESPALRRALADAHMVAPAESTVLLYGETGTGKELFASEIHRASRRRDRALIKVNCAAIPSSLMESEFFGHERGAFTGATQRRVGRFQLADGGTLFLDEIGELPLELQPKLLRAIQEGDVQPVGCATSVQVDVRIIAATNRDLAEAVLAGRFREDLYYRLNVFPLTLPPLRERPEDIPLLADRLIQRIARRLGRTFAPLTPECLRHLQAYPWPGNVRELESVIERAAVTARGGRLSFERALPDRPEPPPAAPLSAEPDAILGAKEIEELERANLLRALERSGWRVSGAGGAADLLGLPPSTLSSRMKALRIRRPSPMR